MTREADERATVLILSMRGTFSGVLCSSLQRKVESEALPGEPWVQLHRLVPTYQVAQGKRWVYTSN